MKLPETMILGFQGGKVVSFNLQTFQKVLALTQGVIQETGIVTAQWGGGDHVGAVQSALQTAGAVAQSVTADPTKQAEAAAATQLASALLPAIFAFASLFKQSSQGFAPPAPAKT
jgi:hypothetical protein